MHHFINCERRWLLNSLMLFSVIFITTMQTSANDESSKENTGDAQGSWEKETLAWRQKSEESLKSPRGWLALTGHFWLNEGNNPVGTSPSSTVRLPMDAPADAEGTFVVRNGSVTLVSRPLSSIRVDGEAVASNVPLHLASDEVESDGIEKITIGDRMTLQLVRRTGRLAVRVRDSENPAIGNFPGKVWFDLNPEFRVDAKFVACEPGQSIPVVNIRGDSTESRLAGHLEFELSGQAFRLDALEEGPETLFIIFKDQTSGMTTYAPGRFISTSAPKDGRVVLDFNRAYNPPCAFSPHTLCPLPPKQNILPIKIEAGEKSPK